jgi:hypothetical protein
MIGAMNKGYAFGFLIVILVLVLGLYVAFTGFISSREALRAQPIAQVSSEVDTTRPAPSSPTPTPRPTILTIPTPAPGQLVTMTATAAITIVENPTPTPAPVIQPTEPPVVQPTELPAQPTATPAQAAPATPNTSPAVQFRLAGPATADSSYPICCYLFGTVRDAGGVPLENVQVQAFNEWQALPPAATKGGGEAGQYNIPIGRDKVTWYVVIVDGSGNTISTQSPVVFDPDQANGFRVDWQRTY